MNEEALNLRYRELACAIIEQAVDDYYYHNMSYGRLEHFLRRTSWVSCMDLDIDALLEVAKKRKEELERAKEEKRSSK